MGEIFWCSVCWEINDQNIAHECIDAMCICLGPHIAETNEVAVWRTQSCLCCGVTWQAEHSRGPLLCAPCFMSMAYMTGGRYETTCKIHFKSIDTRDVCPQATLTNGPYIPLVAR